MQCNTEAIKLEKCHESKMNTVYWKGKKKKEITPLKSTVKKKTVCTRFDFKEMLAVIHLLSRVAKRNQFKRKKKKFKTTLRKQYSSILCPATPACCHITECFRDHKTASHHRDETQLTANLKQDVENQC